MTAAQNPNGRDVPPTLERLAWQVGTLEGEVEGLRQELSLVPEMAKSMVTFGEMMSRFDRRQTRIMTALGVSEDVDGPPPDITGQLKALAAKDAELAAGIEGAKREGWHKLAHAVGQMAVMAGKIVVGLAAVTAMGWSLAQAIDAGVKALGAP